MKLFKANVMRLCEYAINLQMGKSEIKLLKSFSSGFCHGKAVKSEAF